jgi:hypothetical protein
MPIAHLIHFFIINHHELLICTTMRAEARNENKIVPKKLQNVLLNAHDQCCPTTMSSYSMVLGGALNEEQREALSKRRRALACLQGNGPHVRHPPVLKTLGTIFGVLGIHASLLNQAAFHWKRAVSTPGGTKKGTEEKGTQRTRSGERLRGSPPGKQGRWQPAPQGC